MFSVKRKILIMLSLIVIAALPINALSKGKDCTNASKKCEKIKGGVKGFSPPPSSAIVSGAINSAKLKKKEKPTSPIHKFKPQARHVESTTDKK